MAKSRPGMIFARVFLSSAALSIAMRSLSPRPGRVIAFASPSCTTAKISGGSFRFDTPTVLPKPSGWPSAQAHPLRHDDPEVGNTVALASGEASGGMMILLDHLQNQACVGGTHPSDDIMFHNSDPVRRPHVGEAIGMPEQVKQRLREKSVIGTDDKTAVPL